MKPSTEPSSGNGSPSLVERLEAASEGSDGLDYEIHEALGWQDNDECGWSRGDERTERTDWPSYTRSLDAALTLIPAGYTRTVDASAPDLGIDVEIYGVAGDIKGTHVSEPIATCIAALKARLIDVG